MRKLSIAPVLLVVYLAIVFAAACGGSQRGGGAAGPAADAFVPGLGELMSLQQMRHVKLWFAGQAANWELADYEVDELGEGFDDIVKFHPTHKDAPVAPRIVYPLMLTQPLDDGRA